MLLFKASVEDVITQAEYSYQTIDSLINISIIFLDHLKTYDWVLFWLLSNIWVFILSFLILEIYFSKQIEEISKLIGKFFLFLCDEFKKCFSVDCINISVLIYIILHKLFIYNYLNKMFVFDLYINCILLFFFFIQNKYQIKSLLLIILIAVSTYKNPEIIQDKIFIFQFIMMFTFYYVNYGEYFQKYNLNFIEFLITNLPSLLICYGGCFLVQRYDIYANKEEILQKIKNFIPSKIYLYLLSIIPVVIFLIKSNKIKKITTISKEKIKSSCGNLWNTILFTIFL